MASNLFKRTAAGLLLAGSILVAAPAVAMADTIVHTGTNPNGSHNYVNVNTGFSFTSSTFLGHKFETCQRAQ